MNPTTRHFLSFLPSRAPDPESRASENRCRITAKTVSDIFSDVHALTISVAPTISTAEDEELKDYDGKQTTLMNERCIVVDEDDNEIGMASKKACMLQ